MLRRMLSRAFALLLLLILSPVILWFTLPSAFYVVGSGDGSYQQSILQSGKTLTTVHENHGNFGQISGRSAFALEWQLVPDEIHNSISLRISSFGPINLTDLANPPQLPFSDVVHGEAKAADQDGINPPWFSYADATLLFWEVQRDMQDMDIQIWIEEPGVVELRSWKYGASPSQAAPGLLCTISNVPVEGAKADISNIIISGMSKHVPSKTYPMRRIMLRTLISNEASIGVPIKKFVLIPFWEHVIIPSIFVVQILLLILLCALAVMCVVSIQRWLLEGQRPSITWPFTQARAQQQRKEIWGASGPLGFKDQKTDQNTTALDSGPRPLTSPLDFFRSKSPLDDLFLTFRATAWLTQPMERRRRSGSELPFAHTSAR